jgi:hypothetical protein
MEFDMPNLVILDNLEAFADKLVERLLDDTGKGSEEFLSQISRAKNKYRKPIEHSTALVALVYSFTRTRSKDIERSISLLSTNQNVATRLTQFKRIIEHGSWEKGSFNRYFFLELFKGVQRYTDLNPEQEKVVLDRLNILINNKVDKEIARLNLVSQPRKERALEPIIRTPSKNMDHVLLTDFLALVDRTVQDSPEKIQFCFVKTKAWELFWIDATGVRLSIPINRELTSFLKSKESASKSADLTSLSHLGLKANDVLKIKRESLNSLDTFLKQVKLIINPKEFYSNRDLANDELLESSASTFIVRVKPLEPSLYWVNSMNHISAIWLSEYPELSAWMNTYDVFDERLIPQLKAFLLRVNTSSILNVETFKDKLESCLLHSVKPSEQALTDDNNRSLEPQKISLDKYEKLIGLFGTRTNMKDFTREERDHMSSIDKKESLMAPT